MVLSLSLILLFTVLFYSLNCRNLFIFYGVDLVCCFVNLYETKCT